MQPLELSLHQLIKQSQVNDLGGLKNVEANSAPFKKKKSAFKAQSSLKTKSSFKTKTSVKTKSSIKAKLSV
jgi:hypothetical protein